MRDFWTTFALASHNVECCCHSSQVIALGNPGSRVVRKCARGTVTRILNALAEDWARLNVRPGENCVRVVQCVVSEYEGVITFTEVDVSMDTSEGQATSRGGDLWKNVVIEKVCGIENRLCEMENNHAGHYATIQKQMEKIDSNVKRLAMMPAHRSHPASGVGGVGGSNESQPI
jgi:hypothetical protein